MDAAANSSSGRLYGLDALRGIAALCVVLLHANANFRQVPGWFDRGYLAVDLFVMLSGFLMARITEPRLAQGTRPIAWLTARYWRFWPVVALGSLLGIPMLWDRAADNVFTFTAALIANMALLPWPAERAIFPLNVPVWTILAELLSNALHVLVLWLVPTRWLGALALVMLVLTGLAGAEYGTLNVGPWRVNWFYAVPRVMLGYTIGILLWRLGRGRRLPGFPGWLALPAFPVALVALHFTPGPVWLIDLMFIALFLPLLFVCAIGLDRDTRAGRLSAEIAFPLFACHMPAIEAARLFDLGPVAGIGGGLLIAVVVMAWSRRWQRPAS